MAGAGATSCDAFCLSVGPIWQASQAGRDCCATGIYDSGTKLQSCCKTCRFRSSRHSRPGRAIFLWTGRCTADPHIFKASTSTPPETSIASCEPSARTPTMERHCHCISLAPPPYRRHRCCTSDLHSYCLLALDFSRSIAAVFLFSGPFCLLYTRSIISSDTRILLIA